MLFNGSITDAAKQAQMTRLPQVIVVGDADDQSLFVTWCAMHGIDQLAIVSMLTKGSVEAGQLDAVVKERGIVPRVHIIPPQGRGLAPTCLHGAEGFKGEVISQAVATAGGIMMSYGDVMETIASAYVDREARNAGQEAQRTLARALAGAAAPAAAATPSPASPPSRTAAPAAASATAAVVSPTAPSAPSPVVAVASPTAAVASPTSPVSAAGGSTSTIPNPLPNVKIGLKTSDGKVHAVYTNNLWNAATQLAKGGAGGRGFALETGRSDNPRRAYTVEEMHQLPITEGTVVRLNVDPPARPSAAVGGGAAAPTAAAAPAVASPTSVAAAPVAAAPAASLSAAAAAAPAAGGGNVDIRFTLPTGLNQQISFPATATLKEVRDQVTSSFLADNQDMASYCRTNGLSTTAFTLVVAYPPKKLEDNDETNAKTIRDLGLGTKFALRVVMAFVGGATAPAGGAGAGAAAAAAGGTISGNISGLFGRMGGMFGRGGAPPAGDEQ